MFNPSRVLVITWIASNLIAVDIAQAGQLAVCPAASDVETRLSKDQGLKFWNFPSDFSWSKGKSLHWYSAVAFVRNLGSNEHEAYVECHYVYSGKDVATTGGFEADYFFADLIIWIGEKATTTDPANTLAGSIKTPWKKVGSIGYVNYDEDENEKDDDEVYVCHESRQTCGFAM